MGAWGVEIRFWQIRFLAFILLLTVSGCGVENVGANQKVAEQFLKHIKSRNFNAAFRQFDTRTQKNSNLSNFQSQWMGIEKVTGPMQSWTLEGFETDIGPPETCSLQFSLKGSRKSAFASVRVITNSGKIDIFNVDIE